MALDGEHLIQRVEQHFSKLGTIGIQPDGSITRIAWSDEESAAMAYIRAEGEAFGLRGSYDGVGNLLLSTPGQPSERYLVGSHLDSVPHGGNFDGAAGVVAALEAIRMLMQTDGQQRCGASLVAWRGEEYTFNAVYKGSAAAFGLGEPQILHNVYGDQSLRDAIRQQGFDPHFIDEGRPSFQPEFIDSIAGYVEPHIEQGTVLERERRDIGIVTSIAGDRRYLVVLEGRFDHSGATPMGSTYRGDVNLAMAYVQVRLDELAQQRRAQGRLFTQTVGIVNADPEIDKKYPAVHGNSVTKVSGIGYFTFDLMAAEDEFLDTYSAEVLRLIWKTAREFNVKAFIEMTDSSRGLPTLDADLSRDLERAAAAAGASSQSIASGAGHDAVMVGLADKPSGGEIPVGMLFVPCRAGVSHSKEEFASAEHVAKAAEVLAGALIERCIDPAGQAHG
ncbi:MAG: hydantoinase/carbamoylase family amidase [Myxococcales bacterium FL481]|nr:MAG: hydantoinase/carbamoylase family amidase [Myxococcales bacterium FL481]